MRYGRYSRRQVLAGAVGGAATLALGGSLAGCAGGSGRSDTLRAARRVKPAGSDLGAVEHVVFLMHENRSFDHYFGTFPGVNGFGASSPAFAQDWPGGQSPTLLPFHLDVAAHDAECTYDLSHTWQAEHQSWNLGLMDRFVAVHTSSEYEGQLGTLTMGYYEEADIPFYYALARAFTLCDAYHCSVFGPTHPNRLMQMTGTLDPAGEEGGPILVTNDDPTLEFTCSWRTMPEALSAAGVSWRVYNPYGPVYVPGNPLSMALCKNPLMYFKQYADRSSALWRNAFGYYGPNVQGGLTSPGGPNDFGRDVRNDELPAVSWVIPPNGFDEHPPAPAALGEWYTEQILATLVSNPSVWSKTVLFVMYDENDGFFDHVAPPTPPSGQAGEWVTASPLPGDAGGIAGPVGLGVRVPMLVLSPFSAGGAVCSDTFDHTSQLRLLETLFGVGVPNLSAWRRSTTGDLTATLTSLAAPVTTVPAVPATSEDVDKPPIAGECTAQQLAELNPSTAPYPLPSPQEMPSV